jgi:hypothetical protein
MPTESFPSRPDLDQLRRRAKDLAKAARQGEPAALARVANYRRPGAPITLALAQLALAREYGFPSWPRLREAVEASAETTSQRVSAFLLASVGPISSLARRRSFGRSGCLTTIRRSRRTTSVPPPSSASPGTSARCWRGTHRLR